MQTCLAVKVYYLDITGEIDILEGASRFDTGAKTAGGVVCPGAGFGVMPTDCLALMLKTALPEAQELALGFESDAFGFAIASRSDLARREDRENSEGAGCCSA